MGAHARSDRIPALVLGSGNMALGALRCLGRAGIVSYCASSAPSYEQASRWYRPPPTGWRGGRLAAALSSSGLDRAVLIPTSDRFAIEASELPSGLRDRFPVSTARGELLRAMTDKRELEALLAAHDVPRPGTWPLRSPDSLDSFDDDVLANGFLKPRESDRFEATFGRKALRPAGRAAMKHALVEARSAGFEMVLQEYIPGPATNCFLLDGFIDRHGEVRGLFARRRLRQYPRDFGNSSAIVSAPRENFEEAERILTGLLRAIGFRGIFNAEFKRDSRDGSLRLFEVNPRAWWYVEFASRCGMNAVLMSYRDALGAAVETVDAYDVGRTVIYPYFDYAACKDLMAEGKLRRIDVARSWLNAEQMIYSRDDPRPFIDATLGLASGYIKRRLPFRRIGRTRSS